MLQGILLANKIQHLPPRDHQLPVDILACGYNRQLLAPMAVSNGLLPVPVQHCVETGRRVSGLAEAKTIPVGFKTGGTDQGLKVRMRLNLSLVCHTSNQIRSILLPHKSPGSHDRDKAWDLRLGLVRPAGFLDSRGNPVRRLPIILRFPVKVPNCVSEQALSISGGALTGVKFASEKRC